MAKFENILQTIGNTPVVKIGKLAPAGVDLYVKIEAFNPLGSVKDRLALGVIEDAERTGKLKPGQTVIEATSGNTGIGLAMVCAQKGYPLVVTMAESFSVERRKLMRFLGAKVVLTPAAERAVGMIRKMEELAAKNGWFMTRQFENEANADYHAKTTAREIINDFASAAALIAAAQRPLLMVGHGVILADAYSEVNALAVKTGMPVITTLLGISAFPEAHELHLGMPGMHGEVHVNRAIQHADLIVMGAKGLGAVARFLLGSVSTRVVQQANCSVLVVR